MTPLIPKIENNFSGYECMHCGQKFESKCGITDFLGKEKGFLNAQEISNPAEPIKLMTVAEHIYGKERFVQSIYYIQQITKSLPKPPARILDCGSGHGNLSVAFYLLGYEVEALDSRHYKLDELLMRYQFPQRKLRACYADALQLPFKQNCFDIVFMNEFVSHVRDLSRALQESRRILRQDGYLIIADPVRDNLIMRLQVHRSSREFEKVVSQKRRLILSDLGINEPAILKKAIQASKGLLKSDITSIVHSSDLNSLVKNLNQVTKNRFPYRDPITGYYDERHFNPKTMTKIVRKIGFTVERVYAPNNRLPLNSEISKIPLLSILAYLTFNTRYIVVARKKD